MTKIFKNIDKSKFKMISIISSFVSIGLILFPFNSTVRISIFCIFLLSMWWVILRMAQQLYVLFILLNKYYIVRELNLQTNPGFSVKGLSRSLDIKPYWIFILVDSYLFRIEQIKEGKTLITRRYVFRS